MSVEPDPSSNSPPAGTTLSIVTSIYRTAQELPEFYTRAVATARAMGCEYELILVNDASPDNGLVVAKGLAAADPRVTVIDLARNYGQHKAVWAGLKAAKGNLVALLDSDLEDAPEWLHLFWRRMQATGADVGYGAYSDPQASLMYKFGRNAFYILLDRVTGERFPRDATAARLMTRRYVDALLAFGETEVFLMGLFHLAGFSQVPVGVELSRRSPTSYTPRKLIGLFVRGVTSFSILPLILVFIAGTVLSGLAVLFILYLVYQKLTSSIGVEGWASVMAVVMLLGGVNLLFNGIMAIYIGTIFLEVKRRPTVVRELIRTEPPHA